MFKSPPTTPENPLPGKIPCDKEIDTAAVRSDLDITMISI